MRLVKQSFLYFKEGNSDKVYEIDLCDVGNDQYVVNFRYGRRGAQLKEGSKTAVPVVLTEAEKIFDAIETEKINKGYTTSETGESPIPPKRAFVLDSSGVIIQHSWLALPAGRNKAILQRLQLAVSGNTASEKFSWKLSRIIWRAGEYQVKEAAPYIIHLFAKGDQLHQYCCVWALARCAAEDAAAIAALRSIFTAHPVPSIAKLAGIGLLKNLAGLEKETHLNHYISRLPEPFKKAIESVNSAELALLMQERLMQQQPNYNWLEDIYLLAVEKRWMRSSIKKILLTIPLRPGYFKHIRSVFKKAEMLDDFEVTGLLACRFEREEEMFRHNLSLSDDSSREIFVPELEGWVKLQKEFKKATSRLAYSQKTRWYFHGRILRRLKMMGENEDVSYVKLATALLIGYQHKQDFREHYSTFHSVWKRNGYERIETRFVQNAQAVFLHQVLSGDNPRLVLQSDHRWRLRAETEKPAPVSKPGNAAANSGEGIGGFIKKLSGLFGKKKEDQPAPQQQVVTPVVTVPNKNGTPFLPLWNKMPQAYVQLLMDGQLEEMHQFAEENLGVHPELNSIKARLDKEALKKLLGSAFAIPAKFGFALTIEKYATVIPDQDLVTALLNSVHTEAQNKGMQWAEQYKTGYLNDSGFITALIFAKNTAIRTWVKTFLSSNPPSADIRDAVLGKSIAALTGYTEQTKENESLLKDAGSLLFALFADELKRLNIAVVADLLQHENPLVLLFGLQVLKMQKPQLELNRLSGEFLSGLLKHPHALVRQEGIALLSNMDEATLLLHQDAIIVSCLSQYDNVRKELGPIIDRMARKEASFGVKAAEILMPVLLRKEATEGVHADVSKLLCNELSAYLQNANKQTALNLLYSTFSAAQNVGVMILEKYTDPSQLTIPQVIALGAHENLSVREWCWKFYRDQSQRIKYEKDSSIKLTESKWLDTRQFAMQYFREQFTENDWSPEVLITLADSVKPDIEAFGRELITKLFSNENGVQYLLKLSQHPGEKMQLFATNYLERFAADDVAKIQSLDFYFRSVLTRVNKSRIAKNRIYHFLLTEGRKSEAAAKAVSEIVSDVSAIAAIGDKAKCIEILMQLAALYEVATPLQLKAMEVR